MKSRPIADRLAERVSQRNPDDCWPFVGRNLAPGGYGRIGSGGRDGVDLRAHRVAWELAHGPIPDGLCVLHRCDNPPCCNPAHLFLGSRAVNNADMRAKGRAGSYDRRGQQNPSSRLTDAQRDEIVCRYQAGGVLQRELGTEFGVTQEQVSHIVLRWRR